MSDSGHVNSEALDESDPWWGRYVADPWAGSTEVTITAVAHEPQGLVLAALRGALAAALADRWPVGGSGEPQRDDSQSVAITGIGSDLESLAEALLDEMLAQAELHGLGLDHVRLDGMLETESRGYSAWGYLVGRTDQGAGVDVRLRGKPELHHRVDEDSPALALTFTVTRSATS